MKNLSEEMPCLQRLDLRDPSLYCLQPAPEVTQILPTNFLSMDESSHLQLVVRNNFILTKNAHTCTVLDYTYVQSIFSTDPVVFILCIINFCRYLAQRDSAIWSNFIFSLLYSVLYYCRVILYCIVLYCFIDNCFVLLSSSRTCTLSYIKNFNASFAYIIGTVYCVMHKS